MKWMKLCSAVVATLGMVASAQASAFTLIGHHGSAKSCGCAPSCQPECCKPTITKPCHTNVYTYQRKCSDIKPPCCDTGCAPTCCAPTACAPACGAPACAPVCDPACAAPVCAPACAPVCAAPTTCCPQPACGCGSTKHGLGLFSGKKWNLFGHHKSNGCCEEPSCCAPETVCCDADPCEIAKLIYASQTSCYAKDRAKALERLGDRYTCVCNPEIMTALVYGLNDSDERVRKTAADEIGDQLRKNPCCCSCEITAALTCALADCDKGVRRQAVEALEACGYEVVDGCCEVSCCETGCCPTGCTSGMAPGMAPAPAPAEEVAPAPVQDPKAYFPSRVPQNHTSKSKLVNLFGLLD